MIGIIILKKGMYLLNPSNLSAASTSVIPVFFLTTNSSSSQEKNSHYQSIIFIRKDHTKAAASLRCDCLNPSISVSFLMALATVTGDRNCLTDEGPPSASSNARLHLRSIPSFVFCASRVVLRSVKSEKISAYPLIVTPSRYLRASGVSLDFSM